MKMAHTVKICRMSTTFELFEIQFYYALWTVNLLPLSYLLGFLKLIVLIWTMTLQPTSFMYFHE